MNNPLAFLLLPGVLMIGISLLILLFRNEAGMWAANYRRRLADKHPAWKKMAGLPDEQVQHYLSFEFNRRMIVVAALINLAVGCLMVIVGALIGMAR